MSATAWSNGIDLLTKDRDEYNKLLDLMTDKEKIKEVQKAREYQYRWTRAMMERNGISKR